VLRTLIAHVVFTANYVKLLASQLPACVFEMQPDAEQGVRPLLLHGGDSPASSVDRSSPRRGGPQGLRAFRWNAGLPTAFILGGLLTLCVIFLAGDSLGLHNGGHTALKRAL
jgi:hypothetical protein